MGTPTFNPNALQNGANMGLGAGLSINPTGQLSTVGAPKNLSVSIPPTSPVRQDAVLGSFGSVKAPVTTDYSSTTIDTNYQLRPGEQFSDYYARIDAYNASKPKVTANGSIVSANGAGNVTSPSSFNIDMSGPIPSSALSGKFALGDVNNTRKTYTDYVQGLSEATQYSPEYIAALSGFQDAQLRGKEIESNYYTGRVPGATVSYAQGATARESALNSLEQLAFSNAMKVQELIRSGNIEGAKALVDATKPMDVSPGSSLVSPATGDVAYGGAGAYSDYQAQQTYFNLAQNFPDAMIPGYNPSLSAQQNLQNAQTLAAASPSFASRNLIQVTDPAGGIYFVQKNQLQTNPDGSYSFLPSGTAAGLGADKASLVEQQGFLDSTQRALNTLDANFNLIADPKNGLMKRAGINSVDSPIINELNNKFKAGVIGDGDVAAYRSALTTLRAEAAQVLARGGAVTDTVRREADELVPENLSLKQLRKVVEQIKAEGSNVVKEAQAQIGIIQGRLNAPAAGGGTTGGSIWSW